MNKSTFDNPNENVLKNDLRLFRVLLSVIIVGMSFFGVFFYVFNEFNDTSPVISSRIIILGTALLLYGSSFHSKFPRHYIRYIILILAYALTYRLLNISFQNKFDTGFTVAYILVIQTVTMFLHKHSWLLNYLIIVFIATLGALWLIPETDRMLAFKIGISVLIMIFCVVSYFVNKTRIENHQTNELQRIKIAQSNEQMQLLNQTLLKKNKELDRFSYIASHDLKAPLRAINNLSEWIEEDLGEGIPEDVKENLGILQSRVRRMERLINGLLEYSRVGRVAIAMDQINVSQLVTNIIETMDYPETFTFDIQPDMPIVATNKILLQKVFKHLINNAVQYHPRLDGHIKIGGHAFSTYDEFYVQDDGAGIQPKYHEKIFMIFQTLTARDKIDTNGVGLSIVKKIIENEGGQIYLESDEGQGAKFIFTLPKKKMTLAVA